MKQITLINPEGVSESEASEYKIREAARAIVFDGNKNVALLHATKNNYYKLPGGGIEIGEDKIEALKRECLEEIGCDIEVTGEVGLIIEYRKKFCVKQTSYCYIANQIGEKNTANLTDSEVEEGFETVWLPLEEALKMVSESSPTIYQGPYMVARDTAFLEKVNSMEKLV